jgi:hypothetical protein
MARGVNFRRTVSNYILDIRGNRRRGANLVAKS